MPCAPPTASSTARSARSTTPAGRASRRCSRATGTLVYYVFDLLESRRRAARRPAVDRATPSPRRQLLDRRSQTVDHHGDLRRRRSAARGGRSARASKASWRSGRTPATSSAGRAQWLKVKVRPRQELVVAGYTKGQGRRERMGALVLGGPRAGRPALGRQRRHGLHGGHDRRAARPPEAARAARLAARDRAEDAARAEERRRVGRAGARRRGRVRRVDARRPPAFTVVSRSTRGQGARGSPARGAVPDRASGRASGL